MRRKLWFDPLLRRGVKLGDASFDTKYVAFGTDEAVRGVMNDDVVAAFVAMWPKTRGLAIDDGDVTLDGGQFALVPEELGFIIETVASGKRRA